MNGPRHPTRSFAILGLLLLVARTPATLAQQPPPERRGVASKALSVIDLGPEFPGMEGRVLRLRMNTLSPGGSTGMHGHKDKPSIVYVVQGPVTEHRDGTTRELDAGDVVSQGQDHTHALENRGSAPVTLLEAEVIKKE